YFDCISTAKLPARRHPQQRIRFWFLVLILSFELCPWSFAAAPTLDHFFPVALQVGTTNSVTAIGKFDPWPPKMWVDASGIVFKPETNSGKFSIEIATNASVGPHLS